VKHALVRISLVVKSRQVVAVLIKAVHVTAKAAIAVVRGSLKAVVVAREVAAAVADKVHLAASVVIKVVAEVVAAREVAVEVGRAVRAAVEVVRDVEDENLMQHNAESEVSSRALFIAK
jgi:hypothetical protein